MKYLICSFLAVFTFLHAHAQFEGFRQWYPVGDDADINYKTSYSPYETILFEANPNIRYSFFNNMRKQIAKVRTHKGDKDKGDNGAWAVYVTFKPQFRMYEDSSMPVKMPTYKAQLGLQKLFKVSSDNNFLSVAVESGHYSNGQSGSSFSDKFTDGSRQGDSMYTLITPKTDLSAMLNRRSGNFSTNITELNFNFRHYSFYKDPNNENNNHNTSYVRLGHSVILGVVRYHDKLLGLFDIGGYSPNDIAIYGRVRYQFTYEFTWVLCNPDNAGGLFKYWKKAKHSNDWMPPRLSFSEKMELIQGAHPWVDPFRSETRVSLAPGHMLSEEFQVFLGFINGHDNYNYRFVDSGNQFEVGISWAIAAPPSVGISKAKKIDKNILAPTESGDN